MGLHSTLGTPETLPAEVRDRFNRHNLMGASLDIVGWSKVDNTWADAKWRADCADACCQFQDLLFHPGVWPCIIVCMVVATPVSCCTLLCCDGLNASKSQYAIVTNMGVYIVSMDLIYCDRVTNGMMSAVNFSESVDYTVVEDDDPYAGVACCRFICCVSSMPRVDVYKTATDARSCYGKPIATFNGFENHSALAEKIREKESELRSNHMGVATQFAEFLAATGRPIPAQIAAAQALAMQRAGGAVGVEAFPVASSSMSVEQRLCELETLKDKDYIDDDEYARKRSDILASL